MRKKWLYKVENDKISVLLSLIVTVIFAAVTAVLHGFIITLVFTIVMAALTLCSAYRFIYRFHKIIYIEVSRERKQGFSAMDLYAKNQHFLMNTQPTERDFLLNTEF